MLDWQSCLICYTLKINVLLLLLFRMALCFTTWRLPLFFVILFVSFLFSMVITLLGVYIYASCAFVCLFCMHLSHRLTKPTKWHVRTAKTQISLGIRPVWSESSLSAWRSIGPLATQKAHSEDSDQTGRMPRLIRVFAVRTSHFVGFVTRWLISFSSPLCRGLAVAFYCGSPWAFHLPFEAERLKILDFYICFWRDSCLLIIIEPNHDNTVYT